MRPSFFLYFWEIRKKQSSWPGGQSAQRLYNCYNLCPCARPAHVHNVTQVLTLAQVQVLQNSASQIFLLRDKWPIKTLSEEMGTALVCSNFSPITVTSKISFHMKKKVLVAAWNLQSINTLLTLVLSQYSKSGSIFSKQAGAVCSNCCWLGNTMCLCLPVWPSQAVHESCWAAPPAWLLILPTKPSITFWNSLHWPFGEIARWQAGAQTWTLTQTWTWTNMWQVVKALSPLKSQHKLCRVWIILSLLLMPNLSQAK